MRNPEKRHRFPDEKVTQPQTISAPNVKQGKGMGAGQI